MSKEFISDLDKATIEIARINQRLTKALMEKSYAEKEYSDLSYKFLVLQLYMKYNLTEKDSISEHGEITRSGDLKENHESDSFNEIKEND